MQYNTFLCTLMSCGQVRPLDRLRGQAHSWRKCPPGGAKSVCAIILGSEKPYLTI